MSLEMPLNISSAFYESLKVVATTTSLPCHTDSKVAVVNFFKTLRMVCP